MERPNVIESKKNHKKKGYSQEQNKRAWLCLPVHILVIQALLVEIDETGRDEEKCRRSE